MYVIMYEDMHQIENILKYFEIFEDDLSDLVIYEKIIQRDRMALVEEKINVHQDGIRVKFYYDD